ncbi:hypothetical protein ACOSP7_008131 [Xanthoceras sorbifolium]
MMLRLATGEFSPRVSLDGPRLSSALSFSSLMIDGFSRKSITYDKLPEEPIKLSVRKLDGSCFDIEVLKMATVAELKLAVEAAFCHMQGKISWPHVWGHFCLSFEGQKLVTDTDYIKQFYIKDGDQLQFIRHISSSYNLSKKQSKKRDSFSKEQDESLSPSNNSIEKEQELSEHEDYDCDDMEYARHGHYDNNDESFDGQNESSFRRLFQLCDSRQHYTKADAWREDTRLEVWRED